MESKYRPTDVGTLWAIIKVIEHLIIRNPHKEEHEGYNKALNDLKTRLKIEIGSRKDA
jgi:hypothetical protein